MRTHRECQAFLQKCSHSFRQWYRWTYLKPELQYGHLMENLLCMFFFSSVWSHLTSFPLLSESVTTISCMCAPALTSGRGIRSSFSSVPSLNYSGCFPRPFAESFLSYCFGVNYQFTSVAPSPICGSLLGFLGPLTTHIWKKITMITDNRPEGSGIQNFKIRLIYYKRYTLLYIHGHL